MRKVYGSNLNTNIFFFNKIIIKNKNINKIKINLYSYEFLNNLNVSTHPYKISARS